MIQVNGRDRAAEFVSPPPGVEWPPATGPAAQTGVDVEDEDVDWAALGVEEEAAARAAGKRPATSKKLKKRSVTILRTGGRCTSMSPRRTQGGTRPVSVVRRCFLGRMRTPRKKKTPTSFNYFLGKGGKIKSRQSRGGRPLLQVPRDRR